MLELEFNKFMDYYKTQIREFSINRHDLHYLQESNQFILFIKSQDLWEYFTKIPIKVITEFGSKYGVSKEQAIEDFKVNLLYHAIEVKSESKEASTLNRLKLAKHITHDVVHVEKDEAKDYAEFLKSEFKSWEKQIMHIIDVTLGDTLIEKKHSEINKTLGQFLSRLFNVVNTVGFYKKIRNVIKINMNEGLNEAEEELNIDVGVSEDFNQKLDFLTQRQLEGFHVEGGKFNGIKGVSTDIQEKISEIVRTAMSEKKGIPEVKKEVKKVMTQHIGGEVEGKVTEGRATKIARTETTRFRAMGKLQAYKDSGVVDKKKWLAVRDNRNSDSDLCLRLDSNEAKLNDLFFDEVTGKQFEAPPAHPNCRCVITAVLKQ